MSMSDILDAVYPDPPAIRRTRVEMLIVWPMYKAKLGRRSGAIPERFFHLHSTDRKHLPDFQDLLD